MSGRPYIKSQGLSVNFTCPGTFFGVDPLSPRAQSAGYTVELNALNCTLFKITQKYPHRKDGIHVLLFYLDYYITFNKYV